MAEGTADAELVQDAIRSTELLSRTLPTADSYIASAAWAALLRDPFLAARFAQQSLRSFETNRGYPWVSEDWFRCIVGNPFRPIDFTPWRTDTAVSLARQMYASRDFSAMPILADALQDTGCDNDDVLNHCRDVEEAHVRGCWVIDGVLGTE